jgi:hypothetical protein
MALADGRVRAGRPGICLQSLALARAGKSPRQCGALVRRHDCNTYRALSVYHALTGGTAGETASRLGCNGSRRRGRVKHVEGRCRAATKIQGITDLYPCAVCDRCALPPLVQHARIFHLGRVRGCDPRSAATLGRTEVAVALSLAMGPLPRARKEARRCALDRLP